MSNVFQFNFEQTYKDVDVAGKVYRVEFNDDALVKYQKEIKRFKEESEELQTLVENYKDASDEEIEELMEKQKVVTKHVVETFLGKDTFEELYEKAGRSAKNLLSLVWYLNDLYVEETLKKSEKEQSKYLANLKK
ncbi:hypothetical protein IIK_05654 [Bacillus cereus VD102]|nr:hypothetical protein IIK_05654 [Bacillus cereus VD102]